MRLFRIVIVALLALANLTVFLLLGCGFNLFQSMLCILIVIPEICAFKKKKEIKYSKAVYILLTLFVALIIGWFSCFVFGFGKMGVYKLKIKYADHVGYNTEHFPQSIPEGARLKDMGLIPTIMQGSGNVHVTFSANEQTIKALERKAADAAIMSFTVEQYLENDIPKEYHDKAQKIFDDIYGFENTDAVIRVDYSEIIKEQTNMNYDLQDDKDQNKFDDVIIYIIDSNFFWNHIRTNSVVVNHTSGNIEYIGQ